MFKSIGEYLAKLFFSRAITKARTQAAIEAADDIAAILSRAAQADAEQQPELAAQLRAYAATLGVSTPLDQIIPALPEPSTNGHQQALPEAKRPGRPRKEVPNGQ